MLEEPLAVRFVVEHGCRRIRFAEHVTVDVLAVGRPGYLDKGLPGGDRRTGHLKKRRDGALDAKIRLIHPPIK